MNSFVRSTKSIVPILAVTGVAVLFYMYFQASSTFNGNQIRTLNYVKAENDVKDAEKYDRVIHLPEDGKAWNLTIFTHNDWKSRGNEREIVSWFDSNPQLSSLKTQTNYRHYTDDQAIYKFRFAKELGNNLPAIVLQDGYGKVIYKASGNNTPGSATQCANQIVANCPDCRPKPTPAPNPEPTPTPNPDKPLVPDVVKPVNPLDTADNGMGMGGLIIAIIVGLALGVASEWKKTYSA